ncbi:MAG: hypothetical protein ABIS20_18205, partial [Thermoanaerobaculia bacterium]
MRSKKTYSILPALLCGAALFTFACGRGEVANETPQQLAQTETVAPPVAAEPQTHELQPVPQSVRVEEQAPPVADLSARERELADREAELD